MVDIIYKLINENPKIDIEIIIKVFSSCTAFNIPIIVATIPQTAPTPWEIELINSSPREYFFSSILAIVISSFLI